MSETAAIRVLVVDDSVVVRRLVTDALRADPQIDVVGAAQNGRVALTKVAELSPDLVIMDVEMPVMDGIEAVRELRRTRPRLPIVMFSTLTERGASATLDALGAGASDYVTKPANVGSVTEGLRCISDQLIPRIKALCATRRLVGTLEAARPPRPPTPRGRAPSRAPVGVLAVGSSTGGPDALATVLAALPANLSVPVVVVQHMPPVFTRLLAERLDAGCPLTVREAEAGDVLVPGQVLLARGGAHLELIRKGTGVTARLSDAPPVNFCRPSVDVLFRSVAEVYGGAALGLVLTGMGRDGEQGAGAIRRAGGEIVVQDEATSVVWGMPGAVASAGQADRVLPLQRIGPELLTLVGRRVAAAGVT